MSTKITIGIDEARDILALMPGNEGFSEATKFHAMIGIIGIIEAMQNSGYRIVRPLKAVAVTDERENG